MKTRSKFLTFLVLGLALGVLGGCSDDDDPVNVTTGTKSFTVTIENVAAAADFFASGVFNTPVGASAPAAIGPGGAYEVSFGATPGHKLSFATMMVQSNDLFYAPGADGIALYSGTTPVAGDITNQLMLWDAGSEANEDPGLGMNQAPRQSGPNSGPADGNNTVRLVNDGFTYPAVGSVIQATLTNDGQGLFTLRIENVSTDLTLTPSSGPSVAVPMAPGVFVVHSGGNPLFVSGMPASGGLAALAEDGNPALLGPVLADDTGLGSPLAPGFFAVHTSGKPLYGMGMADMGNGLENLAEDGDPSVLMAALDGTAGLSATGVFNTPLGGAGPGPLLPGSSYQFTFSAKAGDRLSFATMLVQSNDLFFGPGDTGLALFDAGGMPLSGDITAQIMLWDAGTEHNQWPGAGSHQPLRQSGPNTGAADPMATVRVAGNEFPYPAVGSAIRITVTAQ